MVLSLIMQLACVLYPFYESSISLGEMASMMQGSTTVTVENLVIFQRKDL